LPEVNQYKIAGGWKLKKHQGTREGSKGQKKCEFGSRSTPEAIAMGSNKMSPFLFKVRGLGDGEREEKTKQNEKKITGARASVRNLGGSEGPGKRGSF